LETRRPKRELQTWRAVLLNSIQNVFKELLLLFFWAISNRQVICAIRNYSSECTDNQEETIVSNLMKVKMLLGSLQSRAESKARHSQLQQLQRMLV